MCAMKRGPGCARVQNAPKMLSSGGLGKHADRSSPTAPADASRGAGTTPQSDYVCVCVSNDVLARAD